jgi:CubicO group peptidase (beta-lactamase class C family)
MMLDQEIPGAGRIGTLDGSGAGDYEPGSGYEYANDGFNLAGLLVQRVSGQSFEAYMTEHVFGPVGMTHTTFDPESAARLGLAHGYTQRRGRVVPAEPPLSRGYNPAGMVLASAQDTGTYLSTLLNQGAIGGQQIIASSSLDEMWTPALRIGPTSGVGLGWGVGEVDGLRLLNWAGGVISSGSYFLLAPDQQVAIGVLANRDVRLTAEIAQDGLAIVLGGEPRQRPTPIDWTTHPRGETSRAASSYVGTYVGPSGTIVVQQQGDTLVGSIDGPEFQRLAELLGPGEGLDFEFVPTGDATFVLLSDFSALEEVPAEFVAGADGRMGLLVGGDLFGIRN